MIAKGEKYYLIDKCAPRAELGKGVFSVSSSDEPDYWAQADYDTWLLEMAGDRSGDKCNHV